jgi:hypothetical protein
LWLGYYLVKVGLLQCVFSLMIPDWPSLPTGDLNLLHRVTGRTPWHIGHQGRCHLGSLFLLPTAHNVLAMPQAPGAALPKVTGKYFNRSLKELLLEACFICKLGSGVQRPRLPRMLSVARKLNCRFKSSFEHSPGPA